LLTAVLITAIQTAANTLKLGDKNSEKILKCTQRTQSN